MFNPYLRLQGRIDTFKVSMDYYGYAAMMIKNQRHIKARRIKHGGEQK